MADGAVKQGVPRQMALQFAAQTVLGAAKTVLKTEKHPAVLRDEVCSPGGSTITGVHELEKVGIRNAFINAIEKATEKNHELGNTPKKWTKFMSIYSSFIVDNTNALNYSKRFHFTSFDWLFPHTRNLK